MKNLPVKGRRQTREWIIQFLFQQDFNPEPIEEALILFWDSKTLAESERLFAERVIKGVISHKSELDEKLSQYAKNWSSDRLGS